MKKHAIISIILFQVVFCFGLNLQDGDILYWAYIYEDHNFELDKYHIAYKIQKNDFKLIKDTCRLVNNKLVYKNPTIENEEDLGFIQELQWKEINAKHDSLTLYFSDEHFETELDTSYSDTTFNESDSISFFEFSRKNAKFNIEYSKSWGITEIITHFERTSFEPNPAECFVLLAVKQNQQVYPTAYTKPVVMDLIGPATKSASQSQLPIWDYTVTYPDNALETFYEEPFVLIDTAPTFQNPVDASMLKNDEYAGKSIYWTVNVKNSLTETVWSSSDTMLMATEEAKDISILFPKNNSTIYTTNPIIEIHNCANKFNRITIINEKGESVYQTESLMLSPYTNRYDLHIPKRSINLIPGKEYECRIDYMLGENPKSTSSTFTVAMKELSDLLQFTEENSDIKYLFGEDVRQEITIAEKSVKVEWDKEINEFYTDRMWGGAIAFDIKDDKLEVTTGIFYSRYDKHTYSRDEYEVYFPDGIYEESDTSYSILWDSLMFHCTQNLKLETDTNHIKLYNFLNELKTAKYDAFNTNTLKTETLKSAPLSFIQTKNVLHFTVKENMTVELYSVQGRLIMSKDLRKSIKTQSIDLSPFSSNVYLLRVKNAQFSKVHKLRL